MIKNINIPTNNGKFYQCYEIKCDKCGEIYWFPKRNFSSDNHFYNFLGQSGRDQLGNHINCHEMDFPF
ncbi:MAG: hypothetical protein WC725_05100 [Patescibacteria group bacterium]